MSGNAGLSDFLAMGEPMAQRPWPRFRLTREQWLELAMHLTIAEWPLLGLWAEPAEVHAAFFEETSGAMAVASLPCPDRRFPSLAGVRPGALRLERTAQDLFGLVAEGLPDPRPWLDHGQWALPRPLADGATLSLPQRPATEYAFLPADGEGLHQVPVGPVHAGIIEPGHFRFTANGETVVRLEARLGYVHKGIESLLAGATIEKAAQLAGRTSGDSTVAYALAFAHAVEAALNIAVPPRAYYLRALMAELERLANHFGDIGAICNDASFSLMHAHCGALRELVLRSADAC